MNEEYVKELEEKIATLEAKEPVEIPKIKLVTGRTKDGFEFTVRENVGDDYEFLEKVEQIERTGDHLAAIPLFRELLGEAQHEKLKDFVQNVCGYVSKSKMESVIVEILLAVPTLKN